MYFVIVASSIHFLDFSGLSRRKEKDKIHQYDYI